MVKKAGKPSALQRTPRKITKKIIRLLKNSFFFLNLQIDIYQQLDNYGKFNKCQCQN
jgi:hypothetical protein